MNKGNLSPLRTLLTLGAGAALGGGVLLWASGQSRPSHLTMGPAEPPPGLPPARIVHVPGHGELFVRDQPGPTDAPPVVLLHGWVATADLNWFTVFEPLSGVGRVLAPDHRGHGRGARHSSPFRLSDVADDVAALIRQELGQPAVVAGYSMGGPVAQLLWQRHPDVVHGLVLCATAAQFRFSPLMGLGWSAMAFYQLGRRLLPRTWIERALMAQVEGRLPITLSATVGVGDSSAGPLLPWIVSEVERGHAEDIAEAGRELGRFDSRDWMGDVDIPVAQIVTIRDRLVPPSFQHQLHDLLGPDTLMLEVDADHDAPVSARTAFATALRVAVRHVAEEAAA